MNIRKVASRSAAFLLALTVIAYAANAPIYLNESGLPEPAKGVIIVNPDGSFVTMSGGGGGGGGSVTIDQTTPGTTNGVQLKAGTAIAGKFGIDQTTPGTTNLVAAGQNGTWTVQPGNTANTTAWKVDGSAVTQPISGTVTGSNTTGNVASAATDSGNPVKIGCVYNSAYPTFTAGQRADIQCGSRGAMRVQLEANSTNTPIISLGDSTDAVAATATAQNIGVQARNTIFNGTTWDRQFTCPSSAVINVTAAATTQIVALSGATIVRVCSFAITASAAGTAKFVYGTGSNCATGQADITGAFTMATGTPVQLSAGTSSVFRGAASNAVCLTATGGNVTGFLSYAQF